VSADPQVEALKRRLMTDLIWRDSVEIWEVPELAEPADVHLADRALRDLHADGLIVIERAESFGQSGPERSPLSRDEVVQRLDLHEHVHLETRTLSREQIETNLSEWLTTPTEKAATFFLVRPSRR
jgi:hypothetical protein